MLKAIILLYHDCITLGIIIWQTKQSLKGIEVLDTRLMARVKKTNAFKDMLLKTYRRSVRIRKYWIPHAENKDFEATVG